MVVPPFLIKFVHPFRVGLSMMLPKKLLLWTLSLSLLFLAGCSRKSQLSTSGSEYREELSAVRPRFEYVEPVIEKTTEVKAPVSNAPTTNEKPLYINKKLEAVLDTLAKQNKSIRYINGYRIQIYVGNIRQEADAAKSYIYQFFPDLTPYVTYSQPTYRVKVGDFMYRSDAEQYLDQLKQQYYSAVILSDRVEIKKSLMVSQ